MMNRLVLSYQPFRIVPANNMPAGFKRAAAFVYDPPLEKWLLMPHQDNLWAGDCIKRDAAGRMVNVSFPDATHIFRGSDAEFAYVQAISKMLTASAKPCT